MSLQLEDTSVTAADYGSGAEGRWKIDTVDMKLIVCQEIILHHLYVLINSDLAGRSCWTRIYVVMSNQYHDSQKVQDLWHVSEIYGKSNATGKCIVMCELLTVMDTQLKSSGFINLPGDLF